MLKANRLERGSNSAWQITIRPDGNGDVTIVLPETTDCEGQGAICTGDGRMLSNVDRGMEGSAEQQLNTEIRAPGTLGSGGRCASRAGRRGGWPSALYIP